MRLTAIDFIGFEFPDARLDLTRGAPAKVLLLEGPNGSGKTAFCDLLFACLELAVGGSGPARFARPPLRRAKATLEVTLDPADADRLGADASASFECFFGDKAMLDAAIDPDPATMLVDEFRSQGALSARLDHRGRSPQIRANELLLDVAMGAMEPDIAPRVRALGAALGDLGVPIDGLIRHEGEAVPAHVIGEERVAAERLSTGQKSAVDIVSTVAAAEHRFLLLDCVDAHLDFKSAERTLRLAAELFVGWQLVITTRKQGLELGDGVARISLPMSGANHA